MLFYDICNFIKAMLSKKPDIYIENKIGYNKEIND